MYNIKCSTSTSQQNKTAACLSQQHLSTAVCTEYILM